VNLGLAHVNLGRAQGDLGRAQVYLGGGAVTLSVERFAHARVLGRAQEIRLSLGEGTLLFRGSELPMGEYLVELKRVLAEGTSRD